MESLLKECVKQQSNFLTKDIEKGGDSGLTLSFWRLDNWMMNAVSVDRNWRSEEEGLALKRERVKILGLNRLM